MACACEKKPGVSHKQRTASVSMLRRGADCEVRLTHSSTHTDSFQILYQGGGH